MKASREHCDANGKRLAEGDAIGNTKSNQGYALEIHVKPRIGRAFGTGQADEIIHALAVRTGLSAVWPQRSST